MTRTLDATRTVAAAIAAVVVVAVLVLAGVAVYQWGRSSAQADDAARTNTLQSCRAAYRSDLIDGPTIDALAAAGLGDVEGIREAIEAADRPAYDALNLMSRERPADFLRLCEQDYG